jgi:hypothetical protein
LTTKTFVFAIKGVDTGRPSAPPIGVNGLPVVGGTGLNGLPVNSR